VKSHKEPDPRKVQMMKNLINRDIYSKQYGIPVDIDSYSRLHDFVDANEYLLDTWLAIERRNFRISDTNEANALMNVIDVWLKGGRED
jgi:hypothetical protein